MRLSEREKKYVYVLVALLLLAAFYYFYTAAVEPFLKQKAEITLELATLEQQALLQQTQIKQLDKMNEEIRTRTDEAMKVVEPFYPALPQDGLLLLMQALVMQSGMQTSDIGYSLATVAEPGMAKQETVPLAYQMKTLADLAMGKPVEAPVPPEAPAETAVGQYAIPQVVFTLGYTGTHEQVQAFILACESLQKTVAVSSLKESKGDDGQMTGTLSVTFYAVEKPLEDKTFEWTLPASLEKTDLFSQQYAEPATDTGVAVPATP